jgi:probable addiction module antidote protein
MSQPWAEHQTGLLEDLRDPEFEIEYLNAALADDDPRVFLVALRNVTEARGLSQVARDAQLNRENLYRMLSPNGNPQLSSLTALLRSIGLRLAIHPDQPTAPLAVAEERAEYNTEDENDE